MIHKGDDEASCLDVLDLATWECIYVCQTIRLKKKKMPEILNLRSSKVIVFSHLFLMMKLNSPDVTKTLENILRCGSSSLNCL